MKLSNDDELISNIFLTILFFLGTIILLKIGFIYWIICCSIVYFFIVSDNKFINFISPAEEFQDNSYYILLWFLALLMPIALFLMYISARASGYSKDNHD
jgi:hypothetical protein